MTKEQRVMKINEVGGICPICYGSIYQYGTPQFAHKIANTIQNRKKWGDFIIDNMANGTMTCSLACNQSVNIGNKPDECLRLVKEIVERELMRYEFDE